MALQWVPGPCYQPSSAEGRTLELAHGHQLSPNTFLGAYGTLVNSGGNWDLQGKKTKGAKPGDIVVFILCLK